MAQAPPRLPLEPSAKRAYERAVPLSRRYAALSVAVFGAAGLVASVVTGSAATTACTTTPTINGALVSGIFIDTDLLLGDGQLACGTEPEDVYNYVAIAINDGRNIAGAGIFNCYAPGVFANLPGTDGGFLDFAVWIYAYNNETWAKDDTGYQLQREVEALNGVNQPDGSLIPVSALVVPDGGTSSALFPKALSTICLRPATWVTTCSAQSQAGVQTTAVCKPLQLQLTPPTSCDLPITIPDAGLKLPDAATSG
jgi:hypothetical protein